MITICINTKNRYRQLKKCLKSIYDNNFDLNKYEIIVIDQSDELKIVPKSIFYRKKIKYFKNNKTGTGIAKNIAIAKAKKSILVFTDDDCLVDKNWLRNIQASFNKNKNIIGIFGKVLPYQPVFNKGKICPCTFTSNKKMIFNKPVLHWQKIGFGNNMAFRSEIFKKVGGFKEWLGPGSIGSNAEDAEFCYRLLLKGYKILYNPEVLIYHDRWLKKGSEEWKRQMRSYSCGELAAYGFYAFQGDKFGSVIIKEHLKKTIHNSFFEIKKIFKNPSFKILREIYLNVFFDVRGLLIGFWFAKKTV